MGCGASKPMEAQTTNTYNQAAIAAKNAAVNANKTPAGDIAKSAPLKDQSVPAAQKQQQYQQSPPQHAKSSSVPPVEYKAPAESKPVTPAAVPPPPPVEAIVATPAPINTKPVTPVSFFF